MLGVITPGCCTCCCTPGAPPYGWPSLSASWGTHHPLLQPAAPPDRKWMPGTAAGTLRSMVRVVYLATSAGEAVGASRPGG